MTDVFLSIMVSFINAKWWDFPFLLSEKNDQSWVGLFHCWKPFCFCPTAVQSSSPSHYIFKKIHFNFKNLLFTLFICCLLPLVCFLPCAFIICKLLKHIGILFPSLSNLLRWNITFFFVAIISLYCIRTFYAKKGNGGHLRVYVD